MNNMWDVEVRNRQDQLTLVVQVSAKLGATPEWAAQWRDNILAHGIYAVAPFFLFVFPDRFYLWKQPDSNVRSSQPNYTGDAFDALRPYHGKSDVALATISGWSLEQAVSAWLSEVMCRTADEFDPSQRWVVDSGLHAAIAGGTLRQEVLA